MTTPLPLPLPTSTSTTAGDTRAARALMCRSMVLRSIREVGAFQVKASGRSARRAGVGVGAAGMAQAFVSGAGSLGAILTDCAGRLVWEEFVAAAGGEVACDAGATKRAAIRENWRVTETHSRTSCAAMDEKGGIWKMIRVTHVNDPVQLFFCLYGWD